MAGGVQTLAMPDDPSLAAWASAQNEAGHCATVLDSQWRYAFVTDELRLLFGLMLGEPPSSEVPIGSNFFSAEAVEFRRGSAVGQPDRSEVLRAAFADLGSYVLSAIPGGREDLRGLVHPDLVDLVDGLQPQDLPAVRHRRGHMVFAGSEVETSLVLYRINGEGADLAGVCIQVMPAVGMSQLAAAAATADVAHLERMRRVELAGRHAAAVLMADLEASSPLSRGRTMDSSAASSRLSSVP